MKTTLLERRKVLRGILQGSAVAVGLPVLDMFLNDNGDALASGATLPPCFGTWFFGLGLSPGQWEPRKEGRDYQLSPQLQLFEPIKDKINVFSGMQVFLDGSKYLAHSSTAMCHLTGKITAGKDPVAQSLDDLVRERLGVYTRFPSITMSCDGDPGFSWSSRGKDARIPAEVSPLALYQRIFGDGFQDPNAADFTPDPAVMLRKSVLSLVADDRQRLIKGAGAADRVRLDEYFTSLRDLEQKLALELQKPEPLPSCQAAGAPEGESISLDIVDMIATHDLFSDLLVHALACGQTRIFNMTLGYNVIRSGDPVTYHSYTHNENDDPELGYQPTCYWFAKHYLQAFVSIVNKLDAVREGDGTLLDRSLIMAYTEHGYAKYHELDNFPFFTAGRAGGGMKTGFHIAGKGDPGTRVGLTCQAALGLPLDAWGEKSNQVSDPYSEVLA